jgi:hypothetical protein
MKSNPIHSLGDRKHVFRPHTSSDSGLVAIPQGGIGYLDRFESLEKLGILGHTASSLERFRLLKLI